LIQYLRDEPVDQVDRVSRRSGAEAEMGADLCAVPLHRPSLPRVVKIGLRRHAQLFGDVIHDGAWRLTLGIGKASLVAKERQDNSEPQSCEQ